MDRNADVATDNWVVGWPFDEANKTPVPNRKRTTEEVPKATDMLLEAMIKKWVSGRARQRVLSTATAGVASEMRQIKREASTCRM